MIRTWGRVLSVEGGGAWLKMPRFNAFSTNVKTIDLKLFSTHDRAKKFKRKFNKNSRER